MSVIDKLSCHHIYVLSVKYYIKSFTLITDQLGVLIFGIFYLVFLYKHPNYKGKIFPQFLEALQKFFYDQILNQQLINIK